MSSIPIIVRGEVDQRAVDQLIRCAEAGNAVKAVMCADGHVGYSQPIGGAIAYPEHISPSGVGYDIGCGNKAVKTSIKVADIDVPEIMDEIANRISFGMGRVNDEPIDHPVIDKIAHAEFTPQRKLVQLASNQLGTVGAGNHYVDLFEAVDGALWIGVHFGSRGFGHKTASGFLALAEGKDFTDHAIEGEMDSPPILFHQDSKLGVDYLEAMHLAGEYAYAGRDVVIDKVLEILGANSSVAVHNHHNFAWQERHENTDCWVVRKGCTPAFDSQLGFVGSTMGEASVILAGRDAGGLLNSTVHGAGRVMSRTQAKGKSKRRKRWECNDRDCTYNHSDRNQFACPDHPNAKPNKRWYTEQKSKGVIDWDAARADLQRRHIELRGGAADEAPGAYKRLGDVLAAHADTITILNELHPIGVAMAGPDIYDPFKD